MGNLIEEKSLEVSGYYSLTLDQRTVRKRAPYSYDIGLSYTRYNVIYRPYIQESKLISTLSDQFLNPLFQGIMIILEPIMWNFIEKMMLINNIGHDYIYNTF